MTAPKLYLHLRDGESVGGPFDADELRNLARQGKITPSVEASVDGVNWFRLEKIWTRLIDESATDPVFEFPTPGEPPTAPMTVLPPPDDSPMFVEVGDPEASPTSPDDRRSPPHAPGRDWTGIADWSNPSHVAPAVGSASTVRRAAEYDPDIYGILRIPLLCAGVIYAAIGISAGAIVVGVKSSSPVSNDLYVVSVILTLLSGFVILLEFFTSVVFLIWLRNVYTRLRVFQRRLGSVDFATAAFSHFVPVLTIFTFGILLRRIWFASFAGKQSTEVDVPQPTAVMAGMVFRGVIWILYFGVAGTAWWLVSINREGAPDLAFGRRLEEKARTSHFLSQQELNDAQEASLRLKRLSKRHQSAGRTLLWLTLAISLLSSAVMWINVELASTVHRNMMALQDHDDKAFDAAVPSGARRRTL